MPAVLKFAKTNEEIPLYRRSLSTDIRAIRMVGLHPALDPLVAFNRLKGRNTKLTLDQSKIVSTFEESMDKEN